MSFSETMILINRLADRAFNRWAFYPGMLFKAAEKWWGDRGIRRAPHEGLDLCLYVTAGEEIRELGSGSGIPALMKGRAAAVERDYLGHSIFIEHDVFDDDDRQLYSIYGHLDPARGIYAGCRVRGDEIIGTIAPLSSGNLIRPHLHLSIVFIDKSFDRSKLSWDWISADGTSIFMDPLDYIDIQYFVVGYDDTN